MKAICHNCGKVTECHVDIRNVPLNNNYGTIAMDMEVIVCDICNSIVGITNNVFNTDTIKKIKKDDEKSS